MSDDNAESTVTRTGSETKPLLKALAYARRGWRVLPVHTPSASGSCSCGRADCIAPGKHPRIGGWADDATTSEARIKEWWEQWPRANVAVAFGRETGMLDIEVDPKSDGPSSLSKLEEILGRLPPTLTFRSGSGGLHRLYRYPEGQTIRKRQNFGADLLRSKVTGIDLLAEGSYAVFPPSRHFKGTTYEWMRQDPPVAEPATLPSSWLAAALTRTSAPSSTSDATDEGAKLLLRGSDRLDDVSIDIAKEVLAHLDPDCPREEWIRIALALKIQFPTDPDASAALDLFDEWSQKSSEKYPGREQVEYQWERCGRNDEEDGRITFRSLIKQARAAGYKQKTSDHAASSDKERADLTASDKEQLRVLRRRLREATSGDELAAVAEDITRAELFRTTRSELVEAYREAFKRIYPGKSMTKGDAQDLLALAPEVVRERIEEEAGEKPWWEPYVFVTDSKGGGFFNTETGALIGPSSFDSTFSSRFITPILRAQNIISPPFMPSSFVLNLDMVEKVDGVRYRPGLPSIFEEEGARYVNTYRPPTSVSPTSDFLQTRDERAAVALVERHVNWLLPDEERVKYLRQFIKYVSEHPTKRVGWCYLISGPEGIGKSFIRALAATLLGQRNVAEVGQASLSHVAFNGWAEGAQLNVIEEIVVDGMRKWEIMNALKAVITNERIDIHRKGRDNYTTANTASYIAFTNSASPLALTEGDRRYFITFTRFRTRAGFVNDLGGEGEMRAYFAALWDAIRSYPDAIAGWLSDCDMEGFNPAIPPYSEDKAGVVEASRSELELALEGILASTDNPRISRAAFSLDALRARLVLEGTSAVQQIGRKLRDMGYETTNPLDPFNDGSKSRWYVDADSATALDPKWRASPGATIRRLLAGNR